VGQNGAPFPNGFNRPTLVSGAKLKTASYNNARDQFITKVVKPIFDPKAFVETPQFVLSDLKRNFSELRQPANYNEAVNVSKKFQFGERFAGVLQVDYFNVLNRTRFNGPDTNLNDDTFGQVTSQNSQISNRQGQAQFRLEF
jgi:hypothetical protein